MPIRYRTSKLDQKAMEWLEKVWAEEDKKRKAIWDDWPEVGIGCSSRLVEEEIACVSRTRVIRKGKQIDL